MWRLVALAILVAGGWFLYTQVIHKSSQPYKFTYSQLDSYTMATKPSGTSLSFKKPVEMAADSHQSNVADLVHFIPGGNKLYYSYISAAHSVDDTSLNAGQFPDPDKIMSNSNDPAYNSYISTVKKFIKDRLPAGWNIQLNNSQRFTNPQIKSNAWKYDLSATGTKDANSVKGQSFAVSGEVVYIISGQDYYWFAIITQPYNWQPNINIWQEVTNSLSLEEVN